MRSLKADASLSEEVKADIGLTKWGELYRIAGIATVFMLVLIPVQIAVFTIWPTPQTVLEWFGLFQSMYFSLASLVPWMIFSVLAAVKFLRLGRIAKWAGSAIPLEEN